MIMTRYLEQLLEDIKSAEEVADVRISDICSFNDGSQYHIINDDDYSTGVKISELFDLDQLFFPKRKLLDDEQISVLVVAIESLWEAYGLNPVFHDNISEEAKYCQLRNYLNHKVYPVSGKMVDVELCDYNQNDCPFIKWCSIAVVND